MISIREGIKEISGSRRGIVWRDREKVKRAV